MRIAAYCRVSTDKRDQINSLEAQKEFFKRFTQRTGDTLVKLYADEGISGTKIKKRHAFLQMLDDAKSGAFDMVVVKDISRFARNTVDLLQSVRALKALGIETQFLTGNMTSMGNSEFIITMFGALAQEESANTSKRIKFGKRINGEKGRVPNYVFGYDKRAGEYFDLAINNTEAKTVRKIFNLYTEDGLGAGKIANRLNERGIKTKRGCLWSPNAVCRLLKNEIYTGKIVNGKEEVADFLTGERRKKQREDWLITAKESLRIIDDETFCKAQTAMANRGALFQRNRQRHSAKHLFSTVIKCKECGKSFRRIYREYSNVYVRWGCSSCKSGENACDNRVYIDERELKNILEKYFSKTVSVGQRDLERFCKDAVGKFNKSAKGDGKRKDTETELKKLAEKRKRVIEMYTDGLLERGTMKEKIGFVDGEISRLSAFDIADRKTAVTASEGALMLFDHFDKKGFFSVDALNNTQLKDIIEKIEVDKNGICDILIKR